MRREMTARKRGEMRRGDDREKEGGGMIIGDDRKKDAGNEKRI